MPDDKSNTTYTEISAQATGNYLNPNELSTPFARRYFSIVCLGRTGSTYLQKLLDGHPQIECRGEDISPYNSNFKLAIKGGIKLDEYIRSALFVTEKEVAGFKMPWDFIFEIPEIWATFRNLNFGLLHLRRWNKLDHAISLKLAQTNVSWNSDEPYANQKVMFTPLELQGYIASFNSDDRAIELMSKTFPTHVIYYEDIVKGKGLTEMLQFLQVKDVSLVPQTKRMRTQKRRDTLTNFDELRMAFVNTPIVSYFDEAEADI